MVSAFSKDYISLDKVRNSKYRVRVIGKIISNLASIHALAILVGDIGCNNIIVKNIQPHFKSAGHMNTMKDMGECVDEFLIFLCDLISKKMIAKNEAIHFIRHYIMTNEKAQLHVKYYLHKKSRLNHENLTKDTDEFSLEIDTLHGVLMQYYTKYF
jgi:tRNA A-37 threonylcarbamoyl transferase component Bud32